MFTLWFTGLSGSGKTTISQLVYQELKNRGHKVELLDGDVVRTHLSKGLGFSRADRDENIKRIGFVCQLLTKNDVIAIAAAISPYRETRDFVRKKIGRFVEVYVQCPLDVCMARDVKGLYKKALAGEISNFTGISDPYEEPLSPEIVLPTHQQTPEESAALVLSQLEVMGFIAPPNKSDGEVYSEEEQAELEKRLAELGYL